MAEDLPSIHQIIGFDSNDEEKPHGPVNLEQLPAHRKTLDTWGDTAKRFEGYLPEIAQLDNGHILMTFRWYSPRIAGVGLAYSISSDLGSTWSSPEWPNGNNSKVCPNSQGLASLSSAQFPDLVTINTAVGEQRYFVTKGGLLWTPSDEARIPFPLLPEFTRRLPGYLPELPYSKKKQYWEQWNPPLVVRESYSKSNVQRLIETRSYKWFEDPAEHFRIRASLWSSYPQEGQHAGLKWSPSSIIAPEAWIDVAEVALARAHNGSLVAACRLAEYDQGVYNDGWSGLGFSLSENGTEWSKINKIYNFGRLYPSLVVCKDGTLVCVYCVNSKGYIDAGGYPRYGVEAIVSRDNGQHWDLEHRYILGRWRGKDKAPVLNHAYDPNSQGRGTSSIYLEETDEILTVYGSGEQNTTKTPAITVLVNGKETDLPPNYDFCVIRWKLNNIRPGKPGYPGNPGEPGVPKFPYDPNRLINRVNPSSVFRNQFDPKGLC